MFHGNEAGIVPRFPSNIRCDKCGHFQHGFFNIASYYLSCLAISRFSDSPWDLEAKIVRPWVDTPNRESYGETVRVGRSVLTIIVFTYKKPSMWSTGTHISTRRLGSKLKTVKWSSQFQINPNNWLRNCSESCLFSCRFTHFNTVVLPSFLRDTYCNINSNNSIAKKLLYQKLY